MLLSSLFCAVLFGVSVATRSNFSEESIHNVDIVKFWNTSELIWTTYTTVLTRRVCKVDIKKKHITNKHQLYQVISPKDPIFIRVDHERI
ncbi:hypothetical protein MRX96_021730 [Rhipicephalus microplus]